MSQEKKLMEHSTREFRPLFRLDLVRRKPAENYVSCVDEYSRVFPLTAMIIIAA
jgi:hypothetical protein